MGVRVPVQLAQRSSRLVLAALAIALPMLLVPVSSADASTSTYSFAINGSTPFLGGNFHVIPSTGSTATGTVTVIVDGTGSEQTMTVSGTYSGLEGTATSIIVGLPDGNSGLGSLEGFANNITTTGGSSGTFGPETSYIDLGSEVASGALTFAIESTAFPNGEIGGSNPAAPSLGSVMSQTFFVGSPGSEQVSATGNPEPTLAISGALPSGITFTPNVGDLTSRGGAFSGTPAAGTAGTYPVTITASNGIAPNAVQQITLVVDDTPTITSASATSYVVGSNESYTITTSNDPSPTITESGALAAGLRFADNGNGAATISGTPALGSVGTYPVTISATDGAGSSTTQVLTLTVGRATQAIAFISSPPADPTYGGSYAPGATGGGSGNPVVFSVDGSSTSDACSYTSGLVDFTGLGTCVLDANEAGNGDYLAAPEVQQSFTIGQAPQAIAFTSTVPASTVVSDTYTPSTNGGASGNPVGVSIDGSSTPGACTYSNGAVSFTGLGSCVIDANQAGDTDYLAAPETRQSLVIGASVPSAPSEVTAAAGDGSASVNWSPPSSDGDSPITGYIVSAVGTDRICTTTGATFCVVSGLTNGSAYTFTVVAENSVGTGSSSATSVPVIPSSPAVTPPPSVSQVANAPPPSGVADTAFGLPSSMTTSPSVPTAVTDNDNGATATVTVPAGALPSGTTLSIYPVAHASYLADAVPSGQSYVASFAVTWEAPNGTFPTSSEPVTMTIHHPGILAGDRVYEVTSSGLKAIGTVTTKGTATVTFTSDPTFLVAAVPHITFETLRAVRSGKTIPIELTCSAATCRGTAKLSETVHVRVKKGTRTVTETKILALASSRYKGTIGKRLIVELRVNSRGQIALGGVAQRALRETLSATVNGGIPASRTVLVQ